MKNKEQELPKDRLLTTPTAVQQAALGHLEQHLLNDFQRDLPLSPTPYADMAAQLGVTEQEVIDALRALQGKGVVSRVGPVFRPGRAGVSTLAAMAVPKEQLEGVAQLVSRYVSVNHNYEREHQYNLWFVATAADKDQLQEVLVDIEECTGIRVLSLPMLQDFHIDLGFELKWGS